MHITKFKQSCWVIKHGGQTVVIDPGSETTPDMLKIIGSVQAVVISHQHPDHLHEPNIVALNCPVYVPADVASLLPNVKQQKIILEPGKKAQVAGLQLTPFIVDHGEISKPIINFGFSIECASGDTTKRILFTGDIARYKDVQGDIPQPGAFGAVMLPVGGGKVFSPDEAITFLGALGITGSTKLLPMHFDGRSNIGMARDFEQKMKAAGNQSVSVLEAGGSVEL